MFDTLTSRDPDDLVLTVNRRLARTLTRLADQQQLAAGATVWPTPRILPLPVWLEQCWEQWLDQREQGTRAPDLTLLTPWQERLLWEQIILASPEGGLLLRVAEAAKNAQQAWNLLKEWQVTPTEADLYDHEDAQAFYAWSTRFATLCRKRGWLDGASLTRHLLPNLSQLVLPKRIFLAGFRQRHDLETPALRAFLAALTRAEVQIETLDLPGQAGSAVRMSWPSTEEELLAAAQWARDRLDQAPDHRIGIVVPALERLLPQVVNAFARVFYPGINPTSLDPRRKIFNLSLGARLTETPLVRDALLLLGLGRGHLSLEQTTALLHSPFWQGGIGEWSPRSLLDIRLRRAGFLHIRTAQLRREAARGDRDGPPCPVLATTLAGLATLLHDPDRGDPRGNRQLARPSSWVERFARWLTRLGWPGERSLTSGEYQNMVAWREGLTLFATLDKTAGEIPLAEALELLERVLAEHPFQPEADDAPVQIMGMLEATGARHTHLWITGLSADGWPPPLAPNPLLPIALQRRHGMPHASFDREWACHHALFQELLASAGEIVCSHPDRDGDQPLSPTPMILTLPAQNAGDWATIPDYHQQIQTTARLERLTDDQAPPWVPTLRQTVDTTTLQAQALCPFQAFARCRLGAEPLPEPGLGLDPSQRGQLVHAALTQLWHHLAPLPNGLHTVDTTDHPALPTAVRAALEQAARRWPEPLHPFFRQLEEARLGRLLRAELALEKARTLPFTVLGQELEHRLTLGALTVRVRLDRVDCLPDGSLVVLDYKTGQTRVDNWFGERPRDPQLPLYLLAQLQATGQPVAALAFCQVRAGACQFNGLADREGLLPQVAHFRQKMPELADWSALIAYWRETLTALGERFIQGDARVDPLPGGCQYCPLSPLCRRHERLSRQPEEETMT
ncbi:MAG: PD-(D/E)XK nuclease family protein [Magnetococcus sp. DMHC-8]